MKTWQAASLVEHPKHSLQTVHDPTKGGDSPGGAVEHAKGVIAAKRLGGQVPQKNVNAAERTLKKEGLLPTERKAPKKIKDIGDFYEKNRPVKGDTWTFGGGRLEIGRLLPRKHFTAQGKWEGQPGTEIEYTTITPKGGRTNGLYIKRTWVDKD